MSDAPPVYSDRYDDRVKMVADATGKKAPHALWRSGWNDRTIDSYHSEVSPYYKVDGYLYEWFREDWEVYIAWTVIFMGAVHTDACRVPIRFGSVVRNTTPFDSIMTKHMLVESMRAYMDKTLGVVDASS